MTRKVNSFLFVLLIVCATALGLMIKKANANYENGCPSTIQVINEDCPPNSYSMLYPVYAQMECALGPSVNGNGQAPFDCCSYYGYNLYCWPSYYGPVGYREVYNTTQANSACYNHQCLYN